MATRQSAMKNEKASTLHKQLLAGKMTSLKTEWQATEFYKHTHITVPMLTLPQATTSCQASQAQ